MEHKFWNKQLSIIDYFMIQSDFNAGINITFYVCIIFVCLSVKYNIFSCLLLYFNNILYCLISSFASAAIYG